MAKQPRRVAEREKTMAKARQKRQRKQGGPEPAESGMVEQVQGLVASAAQAVGGMATAAARTVKDAVVAPEPA